MQFEWAGSKHGKPDSKHRFARLYTSSSVSAELRQTGGHPIRICSYRSRESGFASQILPGSHVFGGMHHNPGGAWFFPIIEELFQAL